MAQWLRSLTALLEDQDFISRTYLVAQTGSNSSPRADNNFFRTLGALCACDTHIYMQAKQSYTSNNKVI